MRLFPRSWRRKIVSGIPSSASSNTCSSFRPSHFPSDPLISKSTTYLMDRRQFYGDSRSGGHHSVLFTSPATATASAISSSASLHFTSLSSSSSPLSLSSFTTSSSSSSSFSTQSHTPCSYVYSRKDHDWSLQQENYTAIAEINVVSFNMLAPVYKRLPQLDLDTGYRKREASNTILWKTRSEQTIQFFQRELFPHCDIIGLQEFWLTDRNYFQLFTQQFQRHGYGMFSLQRTGDKDDAVVILVKNTVFEMLQSENVFLCSEGDRVALLLWLKHRTTGKEMLVANTHLSFPHTMSDRMNQMQQMKKLTVAMDNFAQRHGIRHVTRLIMGDFNVESNSPVCDHLRSSGFYSCFEVHPPENGSPTSSSKKEKKINTSALSDDEEEESGEDSDHCDDHRDVAYKSSVSKKKGSPKEGSCQKPLVSFVSHRNHHQEEVGVDHIFVKPPSSLFPMLNNSNRAIRGNAGNHNNSNNMLYIFQNESHYPHARPSFSRIDPVPSMGLSHDMSAHNSNEDCQDVSGNDHLLSYQAPEDVFVDHCSVVPRSMSCSSWNEEFRISDHRPVSATLIFGRKKL